MSMYLTFTLGKDRRELVKDITDFKIENQDLQKVQGRQGDSIANQVFVTIKNQDGTPYNLTGCNMIFEGKLPDNVHKIYDAKHGVILNAQNGQFRFDLPKPAFAVAGSYVQAFFRIMRNGDSVALLEFDLTVLADLVITDEIPRNYLTPFEDELTKLQDLIKNGGKNFEAAMAQWKADFTKLVVEMTSTTDGINLTISEIKTQLGTLEDKIKADGLLTQDDFEVFEKKINTLLELPDDATDGFFEDEVDEVGGMIPSYYRKRLDELKMIPQDNLNIGFITDNHLQMDDYAPHSLNHYATIAAVSRRARLDAIIAGGDNINGDYGRNENLFDTQQYFSALTGRVKNGTDVFAMFGNHDTGIGQSGHMTKDTTISPDEIKLITKTAGLLYGEKRNGDSLYGYKDYTDKKVRVIWLNSFDLPTTVNSDGTYKFNFLHKSGFQNAQLNWLAVNALKLPDKDWQVLMFSHAPIAGTFDSAELGQTPIDQDNTDALLGILDAYQNGTSYTSKDTSRELPIDLNVDFGNQGKGTLIAFISGHVHQDGQMVYQGINCIQTTCSLATILNSDRVADSENEDAWDIFSIDTAKRSIHAYRLGYGVDRDFSY